MNWGNPEHAGTFLARLAEAAAREPAAAFLLEMTLRGGLLLGPVLLLALLLRRLPAAMRHLVWHLCLAALLLLPAFMALLPALEFRVNFDTRAAEGLLAGREGAWLDPAAWLGGFGFLYITGAALLAGNILLGLLRITLLTRAAAPAGAAEQALLKTLAGEMDVGRGVRLLRSPRLRTPVSWGLLRPVILLPLDASTWPESRLRHVLMHELAHIARLDWLTQLLARLVCACHWINPLAWVAARKLAEEAECACDDAVLLQGRAGCDYAEDLLAIARRSQEGAGSRLLVQAMAESFLGRRLAAILGNGVRRRGSDALDLFRGVLFSLPLLAGLATLTPRPELDMAAVQGMFERLITVDLSLLETHDSARTARRMKDL